MTPATADGGTPASIQAPAKINLTLAVLGGPGPDGYHALRGVFARLDLADDLIVTDVGRPTDAPDADSLRLAPGSIESDHPADLILRATELVRRWAGRPLPTLVITVHKRIPIGAGLGGGSSDGAAALRLVAAAWDLDIPPTEMAALALELGADAPFFLAPSPIAFVSGRGERVEPLPVGTTGAGILLVDGGGKPSTREVFAAYDRLGPGSSDPAAATDRLVHALRAGIGTGTLTDLAAELRDANDLYPAAATLIPHLAGLRARLEDLLGRPALLTGAGSALFLIYPSLEAAEDARVDLDRALSATPADPVWAADRTPPTLIATAIAAT